MQTDIWKEESRKVRKKMWTGDLKAKKYSEKSESTWGGETGKCAEYEAENSRRNGKWEYRGVWRGPIVPWGGLKLSTSKRGE